MILLVLFREFFEMSWSVTKPKPNKTKSKWENKNSIKELC
jgi:hypothetical protein